MNAPALAFLDSIGGSEIALILVIALVLFGGEKLPEVARGIGKSVREFKKASAGIEQEIKRAMETPPANKTPAAPATTTPSQSVPRNLPPPPPSDEPPMENPS